MTTKFRIPERGTPTAAFTLFFKFVLSVSVGAAFAARVKTTAMVVVSPDVGVKVGREVGAGTGVIVGAKEGSKVGFGVGSMEGNDVDGIGVGAGKGTVDGVCVPAVGAKVVVGR